MYIAELHGKLPSKIARSEDILTSNVFSFLKYAKRTVYLKAFLSLLDIFPTDQELVEAEFIFWPSYEDGTEPDVIILAANLYLLFEAKYHSPFGEETSTHKPQLIREVEGGLIEATNLNRELILIPITADYNEPKQEFIGLPPSYSDRIRWINWQAVAQVLLGTIELYQDSTPNLVMALDLYDLLVHKHLRSFRPFSSLQHIMIGIDVAETIFFSAQTSSFRGQFFGFQKVLSQEKYVCEVVQDVFYSKKQLYFRNLPSISPSPMDIFYYGGTS